MKFQKRKRNIRWDLILIVNGLLLLIALVFAHGLLSAQTGIGQEIVCINDNPAGIGNHGLDNNDAEGQTFTFVTSETISAVKINAYRFTPSDGNVINVHITATSGTAPDMNNILGTETFDTNLVPVYDAVTPANNNFSCDPNIIPAQVVIFDPAVPVSGSVLYAVVIEGTGGTTTEDFLWPYDVPANDHYAGGHHWECNVPTACTVLTPATWDLSGGVHDVDGMALFDNVIVVTSRGFDSWLTNFLTQIGMNSFLGKLIVGSGIASLFMFVALWRKAPPLIAIMLGGMAAIPVVGADLIPNSLALTMLAIIGIAIILGLVRPRGSSQNG